MVKVAVAGGAGHTGRHIVDAIVATKKHDVIVLSRSSKPDLEARAVTVIPVDYSSPASLEAALQGVLTVISVVADIDLDAWIGSQLALLAAAKKAGAVRFTPCEYAVKAIPNDPIESYGRKLEVENAVRESGLEYTLYETGIFMNYLAVGTPGLGGGHPFRFIMDVENCSVTIPGDGSAPLVMTRMEDVGAFVAASLDLDKWPRVSRMAGDRKTYHEILAIAEPLRGKKFDVTYISMETLDEHVAQRTSDIVKNSYWQVMREIARKDRYSYTDTNLNDLCPWVKPMGIEKFLKKWWGNAHCRAELVEIIKMPDDEPTL